MELADRGLERRAASVCPGPSGTEGDSFGSASDPGRLQILTEPAVEVVAYGDLPLLASLFPEPQNALGPLVLKVPAAQARHGTDAGPGVG